MKRILLINLIWFHPTWPVQSQLAMNTGDSFATTFVMQFVGSGPCPPPCSGQAYFVPRILGFETGDSVLLELFETSTNQPAMASGLYVLGGGLSAPPAGWLDLQGAVRVSVLSGSIELDQLLMRHQFYAGGGVGNFYAAVITVVPEPSTVFLGLLAAILYVGFRFFRRR